MIKIGKEPVLMSVDNQKKSMGQMESLQGMQEVLCEMGMDTSLIYWQSADRVTMGLYKCGYCHFYGYDPEWEHLQDLRVFNEKAELHIWKTGTEYRNRLITDESNSPNGRYACYEQYAKLWGTKYESDGNIIVLSEERGMKIPLYCKPGPRVDSDGVNAFLRERLYIEYDDSGCAFFADRRFCWISFFDSKGNKEELAVSI